MQQRKPVVVKMGRIFGRKKQVAKAKQQQQQTDRESQSVHRRNVRLFAQPVILLFNVIRFIAFQLWILLTMVCRVSVHALPARAKEAYRATSTPGLVCRSVEVGRPTSLVERERASLPGTPVRSGGVMLLPPPEPALAKQKHHHRKAFEYISKALKLDEEERGKELHALSEYLKYSCVSTVLLFLKLYLNWYL